MLFLFSQKWKKLIDLYSFGDIQQNGIGISVASHGYFCLEKPESNGQICVVWEIVTIRFWNFGLDFPSKSSKPFQKGIQFIEKCTCNKCEKYQKVDNWLSLEGKKKKKKVTLYRLLWLLLIKGNCQRREGKYEREQKKTFKIANYKRHFHFHV